MAFDRVARRRGRADQILAFNVSERHHFRALVDLTKLRWRIERDYQDLKQEVGLGHFEGRGWRGFHHHATLCIAAYGFLVSERETIPPSGSRSTRLFKKLAVSNGYRPRGSAAATRTSHPELDCDDAAKIDRRSRQKAIAMPMLRRSNPHALAAQKSRHDAVVLASGQQRLARGCGSSRADRSIPAPQLFDRNANYAGLHHAKRTGSTQRYINYPAFDERPAIIHPAAY